MERRLIDNKALTKLVDEEVKRTVQLEVSSALNNTEWLGGLESKIITHVQDRITARFSNIQTVPDLVETVKSSVNKLFEEGFVPDIDHMVDNVLLVQAVDQAIEKLISKTVDDLVFDKKWIEKIHNQIARDAGDRIRKGLQEEDVYGILRNVVLENTSLINEDLDRELVIENGIVVVQKHLATETLNTDSDVNVGGALVVEGDLAVKGRISLSNPSFKELSDVIEINAINALKKDFINETSNNIREQIQDGLNVKNILVRGESLVDNDTLSSGITKTSIEQVGTLKDLSVGSVLTANNTRVGINTNAPTSALSVWDNEVTIDIGKRSQNTAQLGTNKAQDLVLVTNNKEQLKIDKDGVTWINKLNVGRNSISHDNSTPGYSGTKGDIVFNTAYVPGGTFAWLCLGAFRWHELKSA
jgi:hypothetical protein|tara:strand:+ start:26 stop:1270 length:1245 start_codon:yes stop_codon:yes gene_type:complete